MCNSFMNFLIITQSSTCNADSFFHSMIHSFIPVAETEGEEDNNRNHPLPQHVEGEEKCPDCFCAPCTVHEKKIASCGGQKVTDNRKV